MKAIPRLIKFLALLFMVVSCLAASGCESRFAEARKYQRESEMMVVRAVVAEPQHKDTDISGLILSLNDEKTRQQAMDTLVGMGSSIEPKLRIELDKRSRNKDNPEYYWLSKVLEKIEENKKRYKSSIPPL